MRTVTLLLMIAGLVGAASAQENSKPQRAPEKMRKDTKLWAAVSVSDPVLDWGILDWEIGKRPPFTIRFSLVNDGDKAIDPKLASSRLFINGKECKGKGKDEINWLLIMGNGPRDDRWESLPPEDYISFNVNMGNYFKRAGTYRIKWKGEGFEAPEVVFRVMPRKKKADKQPLKAKAVAGKDKKLWAAVSVSDPVLDWDSLAWARDLGTRGPFTINFYLVNDGNKAIDPKLTSSRLFINGKECNGTGKDDLNWPYIVVNGPRDSRWKSLPPGEYTGKTVDMGGYFKKPGLYRIKWKGEGFEAPEVVFRVMPRKKKADK